MAKRIIRVFPRRTSMTPRDDYAFVGDPPLMLPPTAYVSEAHIDCTFTWDIVEAKRLYEAWGQYYPVKLGGPAFNSPCNGFMAGLYVRQGVTFTSRGCNNHCPWCLVPKREGKLRELPIVEGNIIQDNNFLQCNQDHRDKVFEMLRKQHGIAFSGGLDARLFTHRIVDDLHSCRVSQIFLACDTPQAIGSVARAVKWLDLTRDKIRCYVLIAFDPDETIDDARERLIDVYKVGCLPFAQLYQPPDRCIKYSREWRSLARTWSRPAAMKAFMTGDSNG